MSERSWSHWHTFAGGAVAGLALAQRPWLIFAGGIVVGVLVMLAARAAKSVGAWLADLTRGAPLRRRHSRVYNADDYARIQREQRERLWRLRGDLDG